MVGSAAHGRSARYRYYTCFQRHRYGKRGCTSERIPAERLEQAIFSLLAEKLSDTDLLERSLRQAAELADGERLGRERELLAIEEQLRTVEQTRERYLLAFERGSLPEEACGERLRTLGEQQQQLASRWEQVQTALQAAEPAQLDLPSVAELQQLITDGLPGCTAAERKHFLGQLIEQIEVGGRDWIKPTLRLPVRIQTEEVERTGIEPVTSGLQSRRSPS